MRIATFAAGLSAGVLFASASPIALAGEPAPPPAWAQQRSDLKPDPAVRFGILPNGMRYAVMRNATPPGQTSLRLRIGSGSLEENDAEQGLAHVLEHMAFKGSVHVPADEMVKILERKGLAFGPDTNAETEWTQTVFMLDLPHSDADTLGTGLMLMRETAGNLTLADKALSTERGVVLSEERLRDTPDYRAEKAQLELFLNGQLAARRFPIGSVEVIKTAPVSLVRAFYEANYRPERATLIAVGDFDPGDMEGRIKALFGDWKGVGPATAEPDLGQVARRGAVVKLVEQPGASTKAIIAWVRPYDASADTAAKERRETVETLGLAVLNRRLAKLAEGANPPFLGAGAGFQNLFRSAKIAVIEATSPPSDWQRSLTAADQEVRRLVAYGVSQPELDREIADYRAGLVNALAGAATRPTPVLASGLVDAVNDDQVFTAPAQDLAIFDEATKGLSAETVNAAVRSIFAGAGPLVELATPTAIDGGEPTVTKAFNAAAAQPLSAPVAETAVVWPYTHFGPPSPVVDQHTVPDLGFVTTRFANGVRLLVKHTDFRKDQVLVSVAIGDGRLGLPSDRPSVAWSAGSLIQGGFGKLAFEDSQRALAGKLVNTTFAVDNTAFEFNGSTRPEDVGTELQIIAAYITDPGFRAEAFDQAKAGLLAALPQLEATPGGVLGRDAAGLFTRGDARFRFPLKTEIQGANPGDLKALLSAPLAQGGIDVTIVGDISPDKAAEWVGETLGALKPRPPRAPDLAAAPNVRFPEPTPSPVRLDDTGRPDQAIAVVAWPATDFFADMRKSRALTLAGDIFGDRLLDKVRIAEGATYSPETRVNLSQAFAGYGYAFSLVEVKPASIPGFFDTVADIAKAMRESPVTDDELERARNPAVAGLRKAQATNEYWLTNLSGALADPRRLALIRTTFPDYGAVTPADIQAAARAWFKDETAWKLVISRPAGS